ncbi:MFS transporter [Tessaracoccus sp. MC1756]|uniref:MFS transporter n=1 Tax=Tessaracoccus sp. MC1756 TaxID=2760311 RepID=UPI00351C858A
MTDRNHISAPGTARTFHRMKVLAVLLLSMGMSLMAISSVNVALPTIQEGLGATDQDLQWVLAGYALAFGVTLIPAGRAGDVLGRGSWFIVGAALFTVASLACGLAPNAFILNAARLVQGVGAGLFSPQVTGMIQQYFSGGGRAKAFALLGVTISASVAAGPVIAGAIIEAAGPETGWRWAFFGYLPLGLAAVVLGLRWFPFVKERRRRLGLDATAGRVDLDPVGSLLITASVVAVMYPFMARQSWAWWLLPLAAVLILAWWLWERRYKAAGREPLVDLELFRYRSFRNGLLVSGAAFLGLTSTFAVVAIFLQNGLGVDALRTGLLGLPNAVLSAVASIYTVRFVMTRGRRLVVFALALMVTGALLSILVAWGIGEFGWSFWWLSATLGLNGAAMGAFASANQTLSMQDVPVRHGGTASGLKQTVERITTALGNAAITGVFFAVAATGSWTLAFMGAFTGIAACLLLALVLGIMDDRQHAR